MENVDWRHLTTGSSGLTGQARSQLNRMLDGRLRRRGIMKKTCLQCHNLIVEQISRENTLSRYSAPVELRSINDLQKQKLTGNTPWTLKCYHNYFSLMKNTTKDKLINEICCVNRNRCISFIKFKNNVSIEEINAIKNINSKKHGTIIAIVSLIITIVFGLLTIIL